MATVIQLPGARIVWSGDEKTAQWRAIMARRLRQAAELVKAHIQRRLGTSSRSSGPSQPGDFPHANTGTLRKSIFVEVDAGELTAIVGTTLLYGLFLEFGTSGGRRITATGPPFSWINSDGRRVFARSVVLGRIEPRPFLSAGLREQQVAVRAVLTAPFAA